MLLRKASPGAPHNEPQNSMATQNALTRTIDFWLSGPNAPPLTHVAVIPLLAHPYRLFGAVSVSFLTATFASLSVALLVPAFMALLGEPLDLRQAPREIALVLNLFRDQSPFSLTLCVAALIALKSSCSIVSTMISAKLTQLITMDFHAKIVEVLIASDLVYHSGSSTGNRLSLITRADETGRFYSSALQLFTISLTVCSFVVVLLSLCWQLTIASALMLLLVAMLNQTFIQAGRNSGSKLAVVSAGFIASLAEALSGIRIIKLFGREEQERSRIMKLADERDQVDFNWIVLSNCITPINEFLGIIMLLAIVLLAKWLIGNDSSAMLLTFLIVSFRMMPIISIANNKRADIARLAPSVEEVFRFLDSQSTISLENGTKTFSDLENEIAFKNVRFTYAGQSTPTIKNLNLVLPKGKSVALVGSSGAGKSTIADLLCRFYDPSTGRITLDGVCLTEFDLRSYRKRVAVVSQDTFLFNNTVRYNITYARPNASESELIQAARRANALEFIERMPNGFDTLVGERGLFLSGGERQRLAIARALLTEPKILILDEATSSLDSISEKLVQEALEELLSGTTTLIVAHRLSTIRNADCIAVLHEGSIVECGTHQELLKQNGHFKRFYELQLCKAVE